MGMGMGSAAADRHMLCDSMAIPHIAVVRSSMDTQIVLHYTHARYGVRRLGRRHRLAHHHVAS